MREDTVETSLEIPSGTSTACGESALLSALGRPFRRLRNTGKPPGSINYIFFQPPNEQLRTLGALCYTPGKQVLFYPGINVRKVPWYTIGNQRIEHIPKSNESLDHITLEPDFDRWHATLLTEQSLKETHIPSRRTRQIQADLVYWFALCVRNPSVLELTPRVIRLGPFPVSSAYSHKFTRSMIEARDGAIYHIVQLTDEEKISTDEFVTFEFYVDRSGRIRLWLRHRLLGRPGRRTGLVLGIGPPALQEPLKTNTPMPYRSHDVMVPGFQGCILVSVCKIVGKLAEDAIISGY